MLQDALYALNKLTKTKEVSKHLTFYQTEKILLDTK